MKQKAIEKIPFCRPEGLKTEKKYAATCRLLPIKDEEHLLIDVFRMDEEQKAVCRICYTAKDYGRYGPETGIWSRGGIEDNEGRLEWEGNHWTQRRGDATYISDDDKKLIKEWAKQSWYSKWDEWTEILKRYERDIRWNRERRAVENRSARLKARCQEVPELPKDLQEWAENEMFGKREHFLYYKRKGSKAEVACSACGGLMTIRTKVPETFEQQFEPYASPKNNAYGICQNCGVSGMWKSKGLVDKCGVYGMSKSAWIGNRYHEKGAILRNVDIMKTFQLHLDSHGNMLQAEESYSMTEIFRQFMEPGKKVLKDWHKYDGMTGNNFWDDCNLYGMHNIKTAAGPVYPGTWDELKDGMLQYSGAKEFVGMMTYDINLGAYMERYMQWPALEMIVKMHLTEVAESIVEGRCGIIAKTGAKRIDEFLGIRKDRVKMLVENRGDLDLLQALRMEKAAEERWTDDVLNFQRIVHIADWPKEYMTMQQFVNRVCKYAGCQPARCSTVINKLKSTGELYRDYLQMRSQLGYDMTNSVYIYPKNLKTAHDKMVAESNQKKADARVQEVKEKFPNIRKNYRKLRNKFYYEAEGMVIRPARSAEEIVAEGRTLHHCVGGDGYLGKHDRGESYILFLRTMDDPDLPFITVEIGQTDGEYKIKQWYAAHDKKPEAKRWDIWLDNYLGYLKTGIQFRNLQETA